MTSSVTGVRVYYSSTDMFGHKPAKGDTVLVACGENVHRMTVDYIDSYGDIAAKSKYGGYTFFNKTTMYWIV